MNFFIIPIHHNHHRPSIRYIKNFGNQKMLILDSFFEIKKIFSGRVISEKDTQNESSMWFFYGVGLSILKFKFRSYTV